MSDHPNQRPLLLTLLATVGLAIAPSASAQDALGSGNALDANPQVGSGGVNTLSRNWRAEIAYGNAIITGNVGGGREFRGNVGYSGTNDFRGSLGSDLIYNFQRDSFYSGLATRQVRGIEASSLMMQGSLPGGLIINRPGAGVQSGSITGSSVTPQNQISDQFAFDQVNTTLRSTSAFTVRDAIRPEIVGRATTADGASELLLTASPLGGIDALSPLDPALVSGRSVSPEQFDFDPRIAIPGFREQAMRDRQLMNQIDDAEAIAQRMPSHSRILNDLRDEALRRGLIDELPAAPASPETEPGATESDPAGQPGTPQTDPDGSERPDFEFPGIDAQIPGSVLDSDRTDEQPVDQLDQLLRGFSTDLTPARNPLGPTGSRPDATGTVPGLGPTRLRRLEDPNRGDITGVDELASQERMERVIQLLREQNTTIDRIAPTSGGSLYAQHMRVGERLLGEGMWFIAEERFVAALSSKPGDAMAAIGRVHAQLGAGLYLSAAVNLSELLRAYPELSPVRYEKSLLPGDERLDSIRRQLRERCLKDEPSARNAGFLLAYIGFQTNRPNDIREGFAVMRRVNEALDTPGDPLLEVLAEIWTKPTENQPEPIEPQP